MKKPVRLLAILLIIVAAYSGWQLFGPTINQPEKKFFYIKTGSDYNDVLHGLKDESIIQNSFFFNQVAKRVDYPENIRPGKYRIEDGMTTIDLVRILKRGSQAPVDFVITKLRTRENLAGRIARYFEADSVQALNFLNNNDSLKPYGLDTNTAMTVVIPNTYRILWTTPVNKIFSRLKNESEKFWNEERLQKARAHNLSPLQVYTMASIIEEETNSKKDKPLIASVYQNRIKKGMRLEADPTVKFSMRDFGLKRIYHKHLSYPSPFNTYQNYGLPPGPICTPSAETIDAVLNAPETNFIFFVAKPDFSGESNFAEDYRQHLVYAKQYQSALDSLIIARQAKQNLNK